MRNQTIMERSFSRFSDLSELEKAQIMYDCAVECREEYPELEWDDIVRKAGIRLDKAKKGS